MKKSFSDFFPVPDFLAMKPAGLSISERAIHAVSFVKKPDGLRLEKFGVRRLPEGAIKEGYINDKLAVTEALRSLQKELSFEFVNASLPEEKAYVFKTKFPRGDVIDFRQSIELRLEENVPISATEAIFDYTIIPEHLTTDHVDISVSVLPKKVVETYLEIITDAGLKPLTFDIESDAIRRAVIKKGDLEAYLVVNVGETSTSLSIVSGGVVQMSLAIPIGGMEFTSALEKHFSVNNETARRIKEERGFVKNRQNMELFMSLMNTVSAIKDEVNKLFIYWQTRQDYYTGKLSKKIGKIILCGRDSNLVGFDEYLSSAVKIPVEVGNVWKNAFSQDDYVPKIPLLDSFNYGGAIGLALPETN